MRIKRGLAKQRRHKKILATTKGYRMSYNRLYRRALEAFKHAGSYAFAHRRHRRGQMRKQWIKIIAAGLAMTNTGLNYGRFIAGLKKNNIALDRKVLAEIAQAKPEHFQQIVEAAMV